MKVKVFEIVKTGLAPLSKELEETIQTWLDGNENIEILTTSQSQHLRENTIFVTIVYKTNSPNDKDQIIHLNHYFYLIPKGSYDVNGTDISDHGDSQTKKGYSNEIRVVNLKGEIKKNKLIAESFIVQKN